MSRLRGVRGERVMRRCIELSQKESSGNIKRPDGSRSTNSYCLQLFEMRHPFQHAKWLVQPGAFPGRDVCDASEEPARHADTHAETKVQHPSAKQCL